MRILSFIKNLDPLRRYPPFLQMIARNVEEFHLCHIEGKLEEKSIFFHNLKLPRIIHFSSLLLALPTALKAFRICRRYRIDLIYVLDSSYLELSGLLTSMLSRTPFALRFRTNEVRLRSIQRYNLLRRILANFLTRLVVTKAKRIVCISHELRDLVLGWGIDPTKVRIVHHGVNTDIFRPVNVKKPFSKVILSLGGFVPGKGASTLLEAAKYLEDVHFFILGPARAHRIVSLKISRIPENVHYIGIVKRNRMPYYYNMSDLLVAPSFTEGFPDALLETFACGRPVIASKVGEIPWIVSKEFGWLIEPGDVEQLKEAIVNAFSDKKRLRAMGEAAREYVVKNFKWGSYVKEMVKTLSECIG